MKELTDAFQITINERDRLKKNLEVMNIKYKLLKDALEIIQSIEIAGCYELQGIASRALILEEAIG